MDATRTSDGKVVTLKHIKRGDHPYEADIALYFSSPALVAHPANHCVHVDEVFPLDSEDDTMIMVMPLLRPYNDPSFDTIGEAVECFRQLFEVVLIYDCGRLHLETLPGTPVHAYASRCPSVR